MANPKSKAFGYLLKRRREAAHLTQAELADMCGLMPKTISAYETGDRRPGLPSARALAEALGLAGEDLARYWQAHNGLFESSFEQNATPRSRAVDDHLLAAGALPFGAHAGTPRNAPAPPALFVGRDRERGELRTSLCSGSGQAVAICGMGGLGKSALAAKVMDDLAADASAFPGGVTWVACEGRTGHDGLIWVYEQLLGDWGVEVPPTVRNLQSPLDTRIATCERTLRERLGQLPGPALVLLDDVEPDFPLTRLLSQVHAKRYGVLITARHKPGARSVRVRDLLPLDVDAAVDLFADCLQRRGGEWDARSDESVARGLAEALGNLPLALELVAARAANMRMGVADLAAEVRRGALAAVRHAPDTEADILPILARSLELLLPAQRARFAALSVPKGADWPLPVVEALIGAVPHRRARATVPAQEDLELLAGLSLVAVVPGRTKGERRVRLHPLLRALAANEWKRQPRKVRIAALVGLTKGVQAWLESAHDRPGRDPQAVMAGPDGPLVAGMVQSAISERATFMRAHERGESVLSKVVLDNLHTLSWRLAAIDLTREYLERALADATAQAARDEECRALAALGFLHYTRGEFEPARTYCERALSLSRKLGLRNLEANMLVGLGDIAIGMRDLDSAHIVLDQALALARVVGDREIECLALVDCGDVARMERRMADAKHYLEQAASLNRTLGSAHREAEILAATARWYRENGDRDQAHELFAQAAPIFESIGRNRRSDN